MRYWSLKISTSKKSYFPLLLFIFFFHRMNAQTEPVLIIKGQTETNSGKSSLAANLGARTAKASAEPVEGVNIEVKKDGVTIMMVTSGKKGKYSVQLPVSTTDVQNEYVIYFFKDGWVPRRIDVSAYLSQNEFANYPFTKYDFEMDISMLKTTVRDIVLEKPNAKIAWDPVKEHKFTFDASYAKIAQKEEQKMAVNPDMYFKNLEKKKKKAEETLAKKAAEEEKKKIAEEEAKRKADEEAKRLAALKEKEEAERLAREKAEAEKLELAKKRIADSLAEVEKKKSMDAANTRTDIKKMVKPVVETADTRNFYNAGETYSINMAKKALNQEREKRSRERGKNLTMKYETINVLTSLLNVIDENDKKTKKP